MERDLELMSLPSQAILGFCVYYKCKAGSVACWQKVSTRFSPFPQAELTEVKASASAGGRGGELCAGNRRKVGM